MQDGSSDIQYIWQDQHISPRHEINLVLKCKEKFLRLHTWATFLWYEQNSLSMIAAYVHIMGQNEKPESNPLYVGSSET